MTRLPDPLPPNDDDSRFINPVDYIEEALAGCGPEGELILMADEKEQIRDDLDRLLDHVKQVTVFRLMDEDDPNERVQLVDYLVLYWGQMIEARRRFNEHADWALDALRREKERRERRSRKRHNRRKRRPPGSYVVIAGIRFPVDGPAQRAKLEATARKVRQTERARKTAAMTNPYTTKG